MNTLLWILTALLAAVALTAGASKTFLSKQKLDAMEGTWTTNVRAASIKTLGVLELLAAVGLIVPPIVGIAPALVPVTAVCWVALMIGAVLTHARLGQPKLVVLTLLYLAVAAFVAWGRFGPESFTA